jgi:ABC-type transporter Mla MlaB component
MVVTAKQLEAFHRFGAEQLAQTDGELSWDELLILWESRNNRASANDAIREGIADVDAGRFQPVDEALESVRQEFGISE